MKEKKIVLSVVICTRNRWYILKDCYSSILAQVQSCPTAELIFVDNASTDQTKEALQSIEASSESVRYIHEKNIGLSHARNRGYQEGRGQWILYLDDDAKAQSNLIERALLTINHYGFDAFGGQAIPWYRFGKPKWMPKSFGIVKKSEEVSILEDGEYFSGMVMIIRKRILSEMQGFLPDLGMSKAVGYGEETELQVRMKAQGYIVGFDPLLIVEHCVLPHKLTLTWHLRSVYAHGRDGQTVIGDKSMLEVLYKLCRTFCTLWLLHLPVNLLKTLLIKDYYIQNAILDSATPWLGWMGRFKTLVRQIIFGQSVS